MTQKAVAELFGIDRSGISCHLANIFENGELNESLVVAKIATTNPHGKTTDNIQYSPTNYNLDAIIFVGYRVNSIRASERRIWQQVTDIFAECSIDYDKNAEITHNKNQRTKIQVEYTLF